jgi:hypothetical protein
VQYINLPNTYFRYQSPHHRIKDCPLASEKWQFNLQSYQVMFCPKQTTKVVKRGKLPRLNNPNQPLKLAPTHLRRRFEALWWLESLLIAYQLTTPWRGWRPLGQVSTPWLGPSQSSLGVEDPHERPRHIILWLVPTQDAKCDFSSHILQNGLEKSHFAKCDLGNIYASKNANERASL